MVSAGARPPGADALNLILEDGLPVLSLSHPAIPANKKKKMFRVTTGETAFLHKSNSPTPMLDLSENNCLITKPYILAA
jgi:hypothetical protein